MPETLCAKCKGPLSPEGKCPACERPAESAPAERRDEPELTKVFLDVFAEVKADLKWQPKSKRKAATAIEAAPATAPKKKTWFGSLSEFWGEK
jgi:predicted amidophosphoribosyltransferase